MSSSQVKISAKDGKDGGIELPKDLSSDPVRNGIIVKTGQKVGSFVDSRDLLLEENFQALWQRYDSMGYILLKNVLNRDMILKIQESLTKKLKRNGLIKEDGTISDGKDGLTIDREVENIITGQNITGSKKYSKLWNSIDSDKRLNGLTQDSVIRYVLKMLAYGRSQQEGVQMVPMMFEKHFSWLRIKGHSEFTSYHSDHFHFKNLTEEWEEEEKSEFKSGDEITCCVCDQTDNNPLLFLQCNECFEFCHKKCAKAEAGGKQATLNLKKENYDYTRNSKVRGSLNLEHCLNCDPAPLVGTCWVPFTDIGLKDGVFAVLPGSKNLPKYETTWGYGEIPLSFNKKTPACKELVWHTGPLSAGDFVIFDSRTVHCSGSNKKKKYQLTLDFRWYMAPVRANLLKTSKHQHIASISKSLSCSSSIPVKPNFLAPFESSSQSDTSSSECRNSGEEELRHSEEESVSNGDSDAGDSQEDNLVKKRKRVKDTANDSGELCQTKNQKMEFRNSAARRAELKKRLEKNIKKKSPTKRKPHLTSDPRRSVQSVSSLAKHPLTLEHTKVVKKPRILTITEKIPLVEEKEDSLEDNLDKENAKAGDSGNLMNLKFKRVEFRKNNGQSSPDKMSKKREIRILSRKEFKRVLQEDHVTEMDKKYSMVGK